MKDGMIQLDLGAVTQPRTLFKPVSWLAKIDFINHLILFNNVLITVLSESKGGKTSFSTLLQSNLDQQIKSYSMTVEAPCDKNEIIKELTAKCHLNYDDTTDIHSIAAQINERKAHVLLIIDNAQNLPEAFIKEVMLLIKTQENFGFFHLCLVSDYSIVATLNQMAVEQFNNLIHTIELGSLNESETRTYVLQRAMADRLINKPLSDEQFKAFYMQTKGNLSKINYSLESFILKSSAPKKKSSLKNMKTSGAVLGVALAVAGLSYMYVEKMHQNNPIANPSPSIEAQLESALQRNAELRSLSLPLVSQIASWQDSSTRQFVQAELPMKQELTDVEEQQANTVAIVDKVLVIPTIKAKSVEAAVIAKNESHKLKSKIVKITKSISKKIAKATPTKRAGNKFTIQLIASHRKSDIHRFRQSSKMLAQAKVRQFTNGSGTWYVLTLGEYSQRSQAQTHAKKLPANLSKLNPWIRSTSGLNNIG